MVDWLAGKRAKGTSSERTGGTWTGLPSGSVGGWVELGRSSGAQKLDVNSLPNKQYYMVLFNKPSGNVSFSYELNGDTSPHYSRVYTNNAISNSNASTSSLFGDSLYFGDYNEFMVSYIANYSTREKLGISHSVGGNASASAPDRLEVYSKWYETSNSISRIQTQGTMTDSNSQMVVLGYDPSDTHTTNFWQELASVELSADTDVMDTGTFTAKKYLWVQFYLVNNQAFYGQFNSDNTSNYAFRYSANGGSEGTNASTPKGFANYTNNTSGMFSNMFIINNATSQKLIIQHSVEGGNTPPDRLELVGKWKNTTDQITSIQIRKESGFNQIRAGSVMKVWGAN